jgi:hypothetical protein
MKGLKAQLFQQYAATGLSRLLAEYRKVYTAKKGDRFNYNGITYEIGLPYIKDGIEYEISSKIPQADLLPGITLEDYFNQVKEIVIKAKNAPTAIDMHSILRSADEKDQERGYVKLKYFYPEEQLYSDQEVAEELKSITQKQSATQLPAVPEVTTMAGKIVLILIQEKVYNNGKKNMELLIQANEEVKKKLCKS